MMAQGGRPEQDSCPRVVGRRAPARKRCRLVFAPPKPSRNPPLFTPPPPPHDHPRPHAHAPAPHAPPTNRTHQERRKHRNRQQPISAPMTSPVHHPGFSLPLSAVRRMWKRRISCGFWRGCCAKITGGLSDDGAGRTTRAGLVSASGRAPCASAEKMPVGFCAAKTLKKSSPLHPTSATP